MCGLGRGRIWCRGLRIIAETHDGCRMGGECIRWLLLLLLLLVLEHGGEEDDNDRLAFGEGREY